MTRTLDNRVVASREGVEWWTPYYIYFVYKAAKEALIISAREMTRKEKRAYAKK
jgi:uncharacterized DUF497 family protein